MRLIEHLHRHVAGQTRQLFKKTSCTHACPCKHQQHALSQRLTSRKLVRHTVCASVELQETQTAATQQDVAVQAVLFDMDGVLVNSEDVSRQAAAVVMKELYGLQVEPDEFIPFMGTGEANFLGGVARKYNVQQFNPDAAKAAFFRIYLAQYAKPGTLGYPGSLALVQACRAAGLKTAVASSADMVKVKANLKAAELDASLFDAIVSADAFERLKPAPDIFLEAARQLGVPATSCIVIEDAAAGVQAAAAAGMRCIGVTTTLDADKMAQEQTSLVKPSIADVTLSDIQQIAWPGQLPPAARPASGAAATSEGTAGPASLQEALSAEVQLPGGYRSTRRDLLKLGILGVGAGSLYVAISRGQRDSGFRSFLRTFNIPLLLQLGILAYVAVAWNYWRKAMSYVSWQAVLGALFPSAPPPAEAGSSRADRVAAFARYIESLERRGGGQQVPAFPQGAQWFNSPPLSFDRELKGKVVVLDFWTYCCINCMHVLPDLVYLEERYKGQPVTVVGVHSAKFDNEKEDDAIRNAVIRYEIEHPVLNDRNMSMWKELGVSSWPTFVVVGPQGRVIGSLAGEGHRNDLDEIVQAALQVYGSMGVLDDTPVPQSLERERDPRLAASPLRYPGKIAVDAAANRLFIADSNNNRIVVCDLQGKFVVQVGGNGAQLKDGAFEDACFNRPQGITFDAKRNVLYVADTENHAVRMVDFGSKQVTTLCGTGFKSQGDYLGGKAGRAQGLNSPWDVVLSQDGQILFVAIAGQHQIWTVDLNTRVAQVFSGDGYERNQNGPQGFTTSWAQPSGLALSPDAARLFVADSESSTVRSVDLYTAGSRPHVGGDPLFADNLFRFGDVDGVGSNALLQHPLAVAALPDGKVLVADSYNHKIKLLDPKLNTISTVAGCGQAGFADGVGTSARLSEPAGLAVADKDKVYIADTNNNLIRVLQLSSGKVSTVSLQGVPPPRVNPSAGARDPALLALAPPEGIPVVTAEPLASADAAIALSIQLPKGYHYTEGAGSRVDATVLGDAATTATVSPSRVELVDGQTPVVKLQRSSAGGQGILRILATVYYCQDNDVCLYQQVCFDVPLAAVTSGSRANQVDLSYTLTTRAVTVKVPT